MTSESEVKVKVDDYPTVHTIVPDPVIYAIPPKYPGQLVTIDHPKYTKDNPPTYDSLYGKIIKAKGETECNVDYAKKVFGPICCNKVCSVIIMVLCIAIPVVSIVIGSINLKNCIVQKYIPIYLIVSGVLGFIMSFGDAAKAIKKMRCEENDKATENESKNSCCGALLFFTLFGWFIAASTWVFPIYGDVNYSDSSSPMYCDKTTYLYTFSILIITYGCIALAILGSVAVVLISCWFPKKCGEEQQTS